MAGPRNEFAGTNTGNLVQAGHVDELHVHPPLAAPTALTGLPADDGLVGRGDELAALATVLTEADAPTVGVIAGLGGVGKTALAVRAARLAADAFPGGVLFIDLHGYDDTSRVSATTALATFVGALGVQGDQIRQEQGALELLYRSMLAELARQDRPVLVLADNAADLEQVLPLRPGDPAHRMLVTSRHSLPVAGARRLELDLLPEAEAVVLLDRAVRAANPDDTRIADEPDPAAALARLCGRLPLALWILSQVLADRPEQPLADVVDRLAAEQDRLAELAYGDSAAVRGVFDASYRRLPAEQARLFRLLAVNRGPFVDLDTAAALADLPAAATRRLLDELRRARLIERTPLGYPMHDLVRLYAAERCASDEPEADRTAATHRLLAHYLAGVRSAKARLDTGDDTDEAVAWLNGQQANLVAAMESGGAVGADEAVRDIVLTLDPSWGIDTELAWTQDSWVTGYEFAAAAAHRLEDRGAEARILGILGDVHRVLDTAAAIPRYEQALVLYRELDDPKNRAIIQYGLASCFLAQNQYDVALDHFAEAAADFQAAGYPDGAAHAHQYIAAVYDTLGDERKTEDSVQRALELFREAGDLAGEAGVWNGVGRGCAAAGLYAEAIAAHQRALAIRRELGDRAGEAVELTHLGDNHRQAGQPADALDDYQQALALHREAALGTDDEELLFYVREDEGTALSAIGAVHADLGERDKALDSYRQALAVFQQDEDFEDDRAEVADIIAELERQPAGEDR